jgi:hypothetical protein
LLGCLPVLSIAGNQQDEETLFNQIYTQKSPKITVTTDFTVFLEKENEEVEGTFEIEGFDQKWDILVEARGKYRRRVCTFPPIMLNFKKSHLKEAGFKAFDKMKLVTHCSDPKYGLQSVYTEFMAYQIYNQITDQSFRTKLVQVIYVDHSEHYETFESWGILLEPNDEMANRLEGKLFDKYNLPEDSLVADNYVCMSLFQFMIGNHDWSIEMYKNIKCLYLPAIGKYAIIPYDFDFTGMVNPEYLVLDTGINLQHPKDRIYLGKYFNGKIPEVVNRFLDKKKPIAEYCKEFEFLKNSEKAKLIRYFNSFFKSIKKDVAEIELSYRIPYNTY